MTVEIIRREFAAEVFDIEEAGDERSAVVIASTDAVDAYGEVLVQDWDLKRYRANPVVLFNHNSDDLPIGSAEDVYLDEGKLVAELSFVTEAANPMAERVWQGIKQGSLRGISVGFRSSSAKVEKVDGRDIFVLRNNELVEISVVPIPANPEAVIESARSMRFIRELAGRGTDDRAGMRLASEHTGGGLALGPSTDDPQIVARIKELRDLEAMHTTRAAEFEMRDRADLLAEGARSIRLPPAVREWTKSLTLDQLRGFVKHLPGLRVLLREPAIEPRPGGAITWRAKTWGELSFVEMHELHDENEELYELMKEQANAA